MEKLWTTTEAAQHLGLTESELGQLVQEGKLTGYKLGGKFLRFRPDEVKALKPTLSMRRTEPPGPPGTLAGAGTRPAVPDTASWQERLRDFVYFYDLYLISGVLLSGLILYLVASG